MAHSPAERRLKAELLSALAAIPRGRVATLDLLAAKIACPSPVISRLLAGLTEDERQAVPWHRVVARGGAIGWGPHRDAQFARLAREGVPVAPAGVVQDMQRIALASFDDAASAGPHSNIGPNDATEAPPQRSRGSKDRPR